MYAISSFKKLWNKFIEGYVLLKKIHHLWKFHSKFTIDLLIEDTIILYKHLLWAQILG
jgi:hypothetical protein